MLNELCRKLTDSLHIYYGPRTTFEDLVLGQSEVNVILQLSNSSYLMKLVSKEVDNQYWKPNSYQQAH